MIFSESLDQWLAAARKYVLAVGVSLVACVSPLYAQQGDEFTPRKAEAKVIFGGAAFDEDNEHKLVGGAVRAYITKRISIEPEYLYLRDSARDQDHLVQANVAYDFATDRTQRLVAYVIGGVGVLHHEGNFVSNDIVTGAPRVFDTSFTTWSASAGVGAKVFVTKRLFVSPEFRLGREPLIRATISVGYAFGGER
jgi:hypothetical protein